MDKKESLDKFVFNEEQQVKVRVLDASAAQRVIRSYKPKKRDNVSTFRFYVLQNLLPHGQFWYQVLKQIKPADFRRPNQLTATLSRLYVRALGSNPELAGLIQEKKLDRTLEERLKLMGPPKKKEINDFDLDELDPYLRENLIGQSRAVSAVIDVLGQIQAGLFPLPMACFFFQGPSGVGKSSLVKLLNQKEYGDQPLIQVNGSEYASDHEISKLIGSPPGYVGSDEPGLFEKALGRHPSSIILIDEVERAHPALNEYLMTITGDGYAFGNRGKKVDFSGCLMFLTSNLGTEEKTLGFNPPKDQVYAAARESVFKAAFLGRLASIIDFDHLKPAEIEQILDLEINKLMRRYDRHPRKTFSEFTLSPALRKAVIRQGYSQEYGAREISRALSTLVLGPLSKELRKNPEKYQDQDLRLGYRNKQLVISPR